MINTIKVVLTTNTNPYHNLALEEYLLRTVGEDEMIMYLWQNRNTVVIGKNQNATSECRIQKLESDGGFLARRLSGGGAVYHDLGNLNFTFATTKANYDKSKQTDIILEASRRLGIDCEKTGRNDVVTVPEGRKFSGHSYYESGDRAFHNGTLMIDVNKDILTEYLNVSPLKLKAKGVKSVKSRVANMKDIAPDVTVSSVCDSLIDVISGVYGLNPEVVNDTEESPMYMEDKQLFDDINARFASDEWKYGDERPMEYSCEDRFAWGTVRIDFDLEDGVIKEAALWSDGMDADMLAKIPTVIISKKPVKSELLAALEKSVDDEVAEDISAMISDSIKLQ